MAHDRGRPRVGDVVQFTFGPDTGEEPVCRAEYRIESAPSRSPTADASEATRIYRTQLLSERWRSGAGAIRPRAGARRPADVLAQDGIAIQRPRWQFIRENRPIIEHGSSTCVLPTGTAPRDYAGARESHTESWVLRVRDVRNAAVEYIRARFRLEVAYYATPTTPGLPRGHYLTRLHFNVLECVASWPSWIEATAAVEGLVDRGTRSNRIPEVVVQAKFSWGWIGSAHHHGCAFRANGLTGVTSVAAPSLDTPLPAQ